MPHHIELHIALLIFITFNITTIIKCGKKLCANTFTAFPLIASFAITIKQFTRHSCVQKCRPQQKINIYIIFESQSPYNWSWTFGFGNYLLLWSMDWPLLLFLIILCNSLDIQVYSRAAQHIFVWRKAPNSSKRVFLWSCICSVWMERWWVMCASVYDSQVFHADISLGDEKLDTVSQPVKEWKFGKAFDLWYSRILADSLAGI